MDIKSSALLAFVLLMVGCSGSPQVNYYTLQQMTVKGKMLRTDAKILSLGPLELPGYINRPQIITQVPGAKVNLDEYSRWAEPLAEALPRTLTANLDQLLESIVVVNFPYSVSSQPDYRLMGRIFQFDADQSGLATLDVQWVIQDNQGNDILSIRRTQYKEQANAPQDTSAVVTALNNTVIAFSRDIARQLSAELQNAKEAGALPSKNKNASRKS